MTADTDTASAEPDEVTLEFRRAVGSQIKAALKAAELTQADLAAKLGVHQVAVSYWVTGRRSIGVDALQRVAVALGVSAASLMPDDDPPAASLPAPVTVFGAVRLELMGHRYRQGQLAEVVIAGTPFLHLTTADGGVELYRPDAVYCLTPATPSAGLRAELPAPDDYGDDDYDDAPGAPF